MPLKLKSKAEYCTEVIGMTFAEIQRDQRLINAISKALKAAHSDEGFQYLIDKKREPGYLYETYVKSTSLPKFVNISAAMMKSCADVANDPKKLAKALVAVTAEVEMLFKTNLRPNFVASTSCEAWCDQQNEALALADAEKRGKKLAKILGIDAKMITKALAAIAVARFKKDKKGVEAAMAEIQAEGDKAKAKQIAEIIEAELAKMGF
jgi:hypothetical protein